MGKDSGFTFHRLVMSHFLGVPTYKHVESPRRVPVQKNNLKSSRHNLTARSDFRGGSISVVWWHLVQRCVNAFAERFDNSPANRKTVSVAVLWVIYTKEYKALSVPDKNKSVITGS